MTFRSSESPASRDRLSGVDAFIDRYGGDAPEVIWIAALALLERAAADARAQSANRWRYYARNEVRRLRRELAGGLMLARLAAALQEEDNARETAALADALTSADAQRRERRREGSVEANRARVRQIAERREPTT